MDMFSFGMGNLGLESLALFLGPFVHEDIALAAGAVLVANGHFPASVALAALYFGIVVSDWALYGLGRLARTSRCARSFVGEEHIVQGGELLRANLFWALMSARFLPWMLLPVLTTCGFLGVGFRPFAAMTAALALVWTIAVFWALVVFDKFLVERLNPWMLGAAILLFLVVVAVNWQYAWSVIRARVRRRERTEPKPDVA